MEDAPIVVAKDKEESSWQQCLTCNRFKLVVGSTMVCDHTAAKMQDKLFGNLCYDLPAPGTNLGFKVVTSLNPARKKSKPTANAAKRAVTEASRSVPNVLSFPPIVTVADGMCEVNDCMNRVDCVETNESTSNKAFQDLWKSSYKSVFSNSFARSFFGNNNITVA